MNNYSRVIICGGSLAGIACAIRLKQLGVTPLVLEQSRFPREKLCGEFLAPDAVACLQELGLWQIVHPEVYGPVNSVRLYNQDGKAIRIFTRWMGSACPYGAAISRARLDHLLLAAARELGVEVLEKTRVTGYRQHDAGGFLVSAVHNDSQTTYACEYFIDASGRNTTFYGRKPGLKSAGFQFHAGSSAPNPSTELRLFFFEGGYGGIQPISKNQVNVCVMLQPELAIRAAGNLQRYLDLTLRKNPAARKQLNLLAPEGKIHGASVPNLDLDKAEPSLIHIGDAMITIDPFTGFGMAHALKTGLMSAKHLHAGIHTGQTYSALKGVYYRDYRKTFGPQLQSIRLLRPLLDSTISQRILWPIAPLFLPTLSRICR